jgi:alpha-mannosidase
MKNLLSIICILCLSYYVSGQAPEWPQETILSGYARKVSGTDFRYHSSIPSAEECMLLRATQEKAFMEWETAPVPDELNSQYASFVWLAGLSSSRGNARYDVSINGTQKISFFIDSEDEWTLKAEDGTALSFKCDAMDESQDRFGFISLKVPVELLGEAKSAKIKVAVGALEEYSWLMTFKLPVERGMTYKSYPAIIKEAGIEKQLGGAGIIHFGKPEVAKVFIENKLHSELTLENGYNYIRINLPAVKKERKLTYKLLIGDYVENGKITQIPVRKWKVNFVQHSHTDIGYTRAQTEILGEHLRYIDYALDYCDLTDSYPDAAKFRWTCEATWPVSEFIRSRPADQIERLRKRVEEGRIEITAMYFNFDELPDEQTLAASLRPLKNIKDAGMDVKVAMQNDVNGIGWCLNDYYRDLGIKYLNMGTHGHRALICFDKPTLFWWESPSGNKMLAYRGEHYMIGNTVYKIHETDFDLFEQSLLTYLVDLDKKGYRYDMISLQHSGFRTDNSPPSILASDMIKAWNEKYEWPKLKTASATDFFEEMEARYGDDFQTIRGAWPDWWTDGFGASAREVATARKSQAQLLAGMSGLTMASLMGSEMPSGMDDRIYWANDALLFYTEHTVGYSESVRAPFHKYTMEQRALKESYAWEAARRSNLIGEEALGMLQEHSSREKDPSMIVYNTLNWKRSGLVTAYIDHQLVPKDAKLTLIDEHGTALPSQAVESRSDGTYWAIWVSDIPAFGYKKFIIQTGEKRDQKREQVSDVTQLENAWYKILIDNKRGAISRLFDKELQAELIDQNARWKLGEFIYETLGNRRQMEELFLKDYKREAPGSIWIDGFERGEIWNTVYFKGNTEAAINDGGLEIEIRLFNEVKRIDLAYSILKKSVLEPEGIYIAFPFDLNEGVLSFDVQGGEIRAGIDQIPGSTNDWNVVQNYARLGNDNGQILLASSEIPLMQFGAINTGRYQAGTEPEGTHIFGWPMNNYWTTNFNPEQHGGVDWVYNLSSSVDNSQLEASRFGWGNRIPFLARVLPGGGQGDEVWQQSIIDGWPENTLLVSAIPDPDGNSAILCIREVAGKRAELGSLGTGGKRKLYLRQVNVLGEYMENGSLHLNPLEVKFIKVSW